jgi:transposase
MRHHPFSGSHLSIKASGPAEDSSLGRAGLVLFWKRLEQGAFRWPPVGDRMMRLSASQLAALVDGTDWSRLHAHDIRRPTAKSQEAVTNCIRLQIVDHNRVRI